MSHPEPFGEPAPVTIGDVVVTPTWVVTPSGSAPVGRTTFSLTDLSQTTREIPTRAIVCAVVFFLFCFPGLLFLLVKEESTVAHVRITVRGPGLLHTVSVPVWSPAQVFDRNSRIDHARSVAHAAG